MPDTPDLSKRVRVLEDYIRAALEYIREDRIETAILTLEAILDSAEPSDA